MSSPVAAPPTARHGAMNAAARWRFPFSRQAWRGLTGNWAGVGLGSSLDFQDHRAYAPGDDPRHIHWQAFARTGSYTMKLYRAEVAPVVDIAVDVSASMSLHPAKGFRTDELLAFCVACADRAAAPVRIVAASGRALASIPPELVRAGRWRERAPKEGGNGDGPGALPWRAGAMKVLISDLMFPGDPGALVLPMAGRAGTAVILAPFDEVEGDLADRGNIQLADCETASMRHQRVDAALAARYRAAYTRHFSLWRESCRARGVLFARVPSEGTLTSALAAEAHPSGAVEAVT